MKRLILLFILTLGFIYEGKAQIAPSTEIYYYIMVNNRNKWNVIKLCMFETNNKCISYSQHGTDEESDLLEAELKLKNYRNQEYQFIWLYNPSQSSSKYYTYNFYKSGSKEGLSFSKDKESMIFWSGDVREYYKKISRTDLLKILGPNLDFLE